MQLKEKIKDELLDKEQSIASWAKRNNFNLKNVYTIISRYNLQQCCKPKSPTVWKIIKQIKRDTGVDLLKARK